MTRRSRSLLALALPAAALMPGPLAAQDRPQDFSLPPGSSPTPSVQGPADVRSGVPIGPRVVERPTPTPTPTPAATQAPTASSGPLPAPAPTMRPASAQPRPVASSPARPTDSTPVERPASTTTSAAATTQDPTASLPGFTPEPIAAPPPAVAASDDNGPQPLLPAWWPWAAGLLAALMTGALGGWLVARRRADRPHPGAARSIKAPAVRAPVPALESSPPAISLEIEQLMRSVMMLTLTYRLTISNRSDQPLRGVAVAADLISSSNALPAEQQLATDTTQLAQAGAIEWIGAHQSRSVSGTLQLPLSSVEVFRQGQLPLCAPLLRLRIDIEGLAPDLRTYLVGIGSAQPGGRVHPLPLSGPPGSYDNARARELAGATA